MAIIAKVTIDTNTPITETLTTGADTLETKKGTLYIRNDSASPAVINLLGDGVSATEDLSSCGIDVFDASAGYDVSVGIGETVPVKLNDVAVFLKGDTVDVTGGGADIYAYIIS